MNRTSALVNAAIQPVLVSTAFDRPGSEDPAAPRDGAPAGSASLLWCAPTQLFRELHPEIPGALDPEHPDGCTDLMIEVDDAGRLARVDLELLPLAADLLGRPIEAALPDLVDLLTQLLTAPG